MQKNQRDQQTEGPSMHHAERPLVDMASREDGGGKNCRNRPSPFPGYRRPVR